MYPSVSNGGRRFVPGWLPTLLVLLGTLVPVAGLSAQQTSVAGQVLDALAQTPIPAVSVSVGDLHTLTDEDGRFVLPGVLEGATLEFHRLGYAHQVLTAQNGVVSLRVLMARTPVLLSEIAVESRAGEMLASGTALAVGSVDREAIQSTGGTSLAESLDQLEGVSTSFTGSWGSRLAVRGLVGERIAVLLDGNRVSRACTYGMDQGLATVDPATVERVEVVTGPGTALYGSGNVGGVVNVVTRRAPLDGGFGGEIRMNGSSGVPGGGLGVSVGQALGSVTIEGGLDASSFDNYRSAEGEVDGSSYRQLTGDARVDWSPSTSQLLSLKGQYYAGRDIGWPMRGGAEIPEETRRSLSLDWSLQRTGIVEGLSARTFFQRLDHHMVMSMVMEGMNGMQMSSVTDAVSFSETSGARVQARMRPLGGLQADVGIEATHLLAEGTRWMERRMGQMAPQEMSFHTWPGVRILDVGAFAQSEFAVSDRLTLNAGARFSGVRRDADNAPAFTEWIPTANAGLRFELAEGLQLRGSVGAGFRTPDPLELYGLGLRPDGFVYRGSSDLDTERSLNTEATLALSRSRWDASVTGFRNQLDNLIVPVLAGDSIAGRPVRQYQGLGESTYTGVSGSFEVRPGGGFTLMGNATLTQGEDSGTGDALPLVPPLEGGLVLHRELGPTMRWIELEWTGAARQDRVYELAGEPETAAWSITNLRAGFNVAGTDLVAGVENVFDALYRGHLDPMTLYRPGRNVFLRVSRTF